MNENRIREEPCGCVYNAATDIYERFCPEHDPTAEALRKLRETDVSRLAAQINRLRDLVKAAAVAATEVDRLIREGGREDG